MSTPIPTQTPPPPLQRALNLLDGVLLRDDVPTDARLDLTRVFSDLLDVSPPYPPTVPDTSQYGPWPVAVREAAAALEQLINRPDPDVPPAVMVRHAVALRGLRDTLNTGHRAETS